MAAIHLLLLFSACLTGVPARAGEFNLTLEGVAASGDWASDVIVTNRGSEDARGLSIRLVLDPGSDASGEDESCLPRGCVLGQKHWALPDLSPGEGTFLALRLRSLPFADPVTGVYRYVAPFEFGLLQDEVFQTAAHEEVDARVPHLAVALVGDRDPVLPGDVLTYSIAFIHQDPHIDNSHPGDAELTLSLPSEASIVWASPDAVVAGSSLHWRLPDLRRGEGGLRVVQVRVDEGVPAGEILSAEADLADLRGDLRGSHARVRTRIAPESTIDVAGGLASGLEWGSLSNRGTESTPELTFELVDRFNSHHWPYWVDSIPPQEGRSWWRMLGVPNGIFVKEARPVPDPSRSRIKMVDLFADAARDIEIFLRTDPAVGQTSGTLRYLVDFGNRGTSPVAEVGVRLRLPSGVTLISAQDSVVDDGEVSWQLPRLGPGETGTREAVVEIDEDVRAGSLLRAASLIHSASLPDQDVATAATLVGVRPPIELALEVPADPVSAGTRVPIGLRLVNRGSETFDVRNVRIELLGGRTRVDLFPAEFPSLPSGSGATIPGTLYPHYLSRPGSLVPTAAYVDGVIDGVSEFTASDHSLLLIAPREPQVPFPDPVGARCQRIQLRSLARYCESQLRCRAETLESRKRGTLCQNAAIDRHLRALRRASNEARHSNSRCPWDAWNDGDLGWDPSEIERRIQIPAASETRAQRKLAADLFRAAASVCRAEFAEWVRRAGRGGGPSAERTRGRFVEHATQLIERADRRGVAYAGWRPEEIADYLRSTAADAADVSGGGGSPP